MPIHTRRHCCNPGETGWPEATGIVRTERRERDNDLTAGISQTCRCETLAWSRLSRRILKHEPRQRRHLYGILAMGRDKQQPRSISGRQSEYRERHKLSGLNQPSRASYPCYRLPLQTNWQRRSRPVSRKWRSCGSCTTGHTPESIELPLLIRKSRTSALRLLQQSPLTAQCCAMQSKSICG